MIIGGVINVEI